MDTPLFCLILSQISVFVRLCHTPVHHQLDAVLKEQDQFVLQKHRVIPHTLSHPGQEEAGDAIGKDILYKLPVLFVHQLARPGPVQRRL